MKKKMILAGGNGFLGKVLARHFANDYDIVILSRGTGGPNNVSAAENMPGVSYVSWDAMTLGPWKESLEHADVLINLAGRTVDCRYNEKNKREILESRVRSTNVLGEAVLACLHPPKLWINSASATIYRHSEDKQMSEAEGETGKGFSVDVCQAWEKAFFDFDLPQTRQVATRISIVLGKTGGAIKPLINLARLGLGGKQGNGNQFFSWIHEDDYARAIEFIIGRESLFGPVNVVSPTPVTNRKLMETIRKAVGAPFGLPMPKWLLAIGAFLIRTETELILKSRNVIPEKLADEGFEFTYPTLESAIRQITAE